MTASQYNKALSHFKLTREDATLLFNGTTGNRSGRRWSVAGAPYHVALILTMMHQLKLSPELVDSLGKKWREQKQTNQ
jgi:hypothetical protein